MTIAQNRVRRVAAWGAAVVGAVLLVLTFVMCGEYYPFQLYPDSLCPCTLSPVVALLAGVGEK